MKLLVFVFLTTMTICCQNKPTETNKSIPIYEVDLDKVEKISVYDIFSKVDIIPLKTPDSIVCSGIENTVYKDNIFLHDWRQKTIFCFDLNGNYRYKISAEGRGPQEYKEILSFTIDSYNEYVVLLGHYSMLQFDLSGNFIKKIIYPQGLIVHSAKMINRDTMLCLTSTNNDNKRKIINYLSLKESKIIASCYSEDPIFPVSPFLFDYNNTLYYTIPKTSIIYSVNKLQLTPEYKWDFGKYNYDYENLSIPLFANRTDMLKMQRTWLFSNCPWLMGTIAENSNYKFAEISFFKNTDFLKVKPPAYHIFWNKKTGEYKVVSQFKEGRVFHTFSSWTENAIYHIEEISSITKYIILEALTPENRKILEDLPEDSNPVILKYSFK